jgi:hypothetical protein
MEITRTINVLTLAALLMLTGCFGLIDDEAIPPVDGQTTNGATETNNAPILTTSETLNELAAEGSEPIYNADDELTGFEFMLYYAAVDVDGDNMTMGWDTDLDGTIDLPVSDSSGFTTFALPLTAMNELNGFGYDDVYHTMLAFIAIDEHGEGSALFVESFNYDGNADGGSDGNLALYAFSGEDAQGYPTTGTEDNLIMLTMDQGGDINWASVSVKLSIDGGAPVFCDNPGNTGGSCVLIDNGRDTSDQFWSVGDTVTIQETGQDLCSSACSIDVTITDTREEKVIDTTNNVVAE